MDLNINGAVAIVAGSSRGIGRATARAFLAEGCQTLITGRDPSALEATRSEFAMSFGSTSVLAFAGDLGSGEAARDCRQFVESRWGTPDFLVANIGAGRFPGGPLPEIPTWHTAFDVNLWANVCIVQEFLPGMLSRKAGSIVVVGSIAGVENIAAPIPYSAAKAALGSWVKNLASQVGRNGVRVNMISPGNIFFEGGVWARKSADEPDSVKNYLDSEVPLGRFGTPDEIADVVVFLCSPRAAFITGARVIADGGQTKGT